VNKDCSSYEPLSLTNIKFFECVLMDLIAGKRNAMVCFALDPRWVVSVGAFQHARFMNPDEENCA